MLRPSMGVGSVGGHGGHSELLAGNRLTRTLALVPLQLVNHGGIPIIPSGV